MKIDIEDVLEHLNWRSSVNDRDISEIEWYRDGEKVDVSAEEIEEWRFTGLNNIDFVTFYLLDRIHKEEE